jgi:hypothetical protein
LNHRFKPVFVLLAQLEGGTLGALTLGGGSGAAADLNGGQSAALLGGAVIGAAGNAAVDAGIDSLVVHGNDLLEMTVSTFHAEHFRV